MHNRQPLFLFSGDLIADRRYEYAQDFLARGDLAAAADLFAQAAERAPGFIAAWYALGDTQERLGENTAAADSFARAHAGDPEDRIGAGLRLARLGVGSAESAMSPAYVRAVFDQYAPDFDRALTQGLRYRGPQLLFDAVAGVCQQSQRPMHFDRALDLGCGTGLAGEFFAERIDSLVGVDLSPAMIAAAERKGYYNHLHVAEMLAFARAEHDASFDFAIAADALVYLGDLRPLLKQLARVLEPGGLLAFSLETHAGEAVVLGEKLRYAHARAYVEQRLSASGFAIASLEAASTRAEGGVAVPGLIAVAVRS